VGIGLNVNQTLFPDWIPNPTSLQLVLGSELPLLQVLNSAVECISRRYNQLALCPTQPNPAIDHDYLSQLLQLGVQASYLFHDSPVKATIHGVNRFGHLELITDSGVHLTCQLKELKYLF
jgi:BirA family biotin operon repressor/biotin-[acetyl-CoA-carboxylase] ligase